MAMIQKLSVLWWCGWCLLGQGRTVVVAEEREMQARAFQNVVNRAMIDNNNNEKRQELACNKNLQTAKCRRWTNVFSAFTGKNTMVEIPCGTCVWLDLPELDLRGGLHVRGKLIIPEFKNRMYKIRVSNVLVEGELEIVSTQRVSDTPVVTFEFVERGAPDMSCFGSKKGMIVSGGKVNFDGLPRKTPVWLKLFDVITNPDQPNVVEGIVVDDSVVNKWARGAELLITSHTKDWKGHQVRRILKFVAYNASKIGILLDHPIERPITVRDSRDFAVEVALLSRNIQFNAKVEQEHGGHFVVTHTNVTQSIVGVEFRGFGQQGCLGRYPIHFHLCGNIEGSVLAKNTIRQSMQRCVVVHGTDNLLIEENIAYDTKGHCFLLEDGIESGNRFISNLGAQTGIPKRGIPDFGPNGIETDLWPSTYWITTPANTWIGNVAAGSEGSGFWFELLKRGVLADQYPDFNPKSAPLVRFANNVAHSNADRGLRTYPSGYLPEQVQTIFGMKSFRNGVMGIFVHNSKNIELKNTLVADNGLVGVDIDRVNGVKLVDSTIIGVSPVSPGVRPFCRTVGVDLHTWKMDHKEDGVVLENTSFSGFNRSICVDAMPIRFDSNSRTQQFDSFTNIDGVDFEKGVNWVNFCEAHAANVKDTYLTDIDGSLSPFLVKPNGVSTAIGAGASSLEFIADNKCRLAPDLCYTYCRNTCLRTFRFGIDPAGTENYQLEVCKGLNARRTCIRIQGPQTTELSGPDLYDSTPRYFLVHVPDDSSFDAVFLDNNGDETYPNFVTFTKEATSCTDTTGMINLYKPNIPRKSNKCNQLIRNGNVEASNSAPTFWLQRFSGLALARRKGLNGSNALDAVFSSSTARIVQYIDTRCLEVNRGRFYKIEAYIRLESSDGSTFFCDPDRRDCPTVGLFLESGGFLPVAQVEPETIKDGFQLALGFVDVGDQLAESNQVHLYVLSQVGGKRMYVDNVSMQLVGNEYQYCKNLILNSKSSLEHMWDVVDGPGSVMTVAVVGDLVGVASDTAIRFSGRTSFSDGIEYNGWQNIEVACLTAGSRWIISAKFFLVNRLTGRGADCDLEEDCPSIRLALRNSSGERFFVSKTRSYTASTWESKAWNRFKVVLELPSNMKKPVDKAVLDIADFSAQYDLLVADFSMKPEL